MKYTYAYKTSDGVRHEDTMDAASREEVFTALRAKGIKAIKVVAADGSKANGEVRGVRRRVVAAIVVIVSVLVGSIAYFGGSRSTPPNVAAETANSDTNSVSLIETANFDTNSVSLIETANSEQARRQVIGDVAIIEKGIRNGWSDVFELEGDRFLASFAIPGVKAGQRNTSEKEFTAALENKCEIKPNDSIEVKQIKAMVEGMKEEARRYIAAGGSIISYGKRLTERQDAEIAIYERIKTDLEKAHSFMSEDEYMIYWEKRNDELRNLGIKTIGLE